MNKQLKISSFFTKAQTSLTKTNKERNKDSGSSKENVEASENKLFQQRQDIKDDNLSLTLIDNFLDKKSTQSLYNTLIKKLNIKVYNKDNTLTKKRQKFTFGCIPYYRFVYLGKEIVNKVEDWNQIPVLKLLAEKCSEITKENYNICVVTYYNNGEVIIKPHRDKEMINTYITSLSLGETRTMRFEKGNKKIDCELKDGTLCIINPPTNDYYLHSIPEEKYKTNPRISVIFRRL